ncbi:MAG: flagellar hook assembly protein FlgD [Gallionella sp.]|nr:flagellar hook assembly protein FlgD [Gallionella sp.]MDD4945739.1 flagellar hook assembly protein FlgD [Gallionella sp.]MDD5612924.1 flagellar hook assembly protein FlgD [Gallionella sp.]
MITTTQPTDTAALFASMNGTAKTGTSANATNAMQDRFMTLLVTQLKNQDPLNPMDNAQMTSQMAQISTVSGLDKLNATLQALSASMTPNQAVQATGMIGHGVLIPGSGLQLANGTALGGFELSQQADVAQVAIYDQAGALVRNLDLGAQQTGIVKWQWDGMDNTGAALPAGNYSFTVNASLAGNSVAPSSLQFGMVNSVTQGAAGVTMSVGAADNIALSQVKQIL